MTDIQPKTSLFDVIRKDFPQNSSLGSGMGFGISLIDSVLFNTYDMVDFYNLLDFSWPMTAAAFFAVGMSNANKIKSQLEFVVDAATVVLTATVAFNVTKYAVGLAANYIQ